jgi:hypothetical protein
MRNASRGASRFRPVPSIVQYVYKWYPQTSGVYLALFADDTCMYTIDRKEGYVLRKLQRGLNSTEMWCKHWNIKINKDKTPAVWFFQRQVHLTLNGQNIPFVNHVKYLSVCNHWQEDYMDIAYRHDRRQGLQNIYYSLVPVQKWAIKR